MSSTVIGLEVHLQLATKTKIFCSCPTTFGASPNSQVCPVCLGFPGVLPVLNRRVLEFGLRVALGLSCSISPRIVFHRKNYFYPDLPKAFQISQYDLPLGKEGFVELPTRTIRVERVHMEEDAGKLIHQESSSLVDYNRTGVPLLEIVSAPDMTSPEEAHTYLKTLKGILEYLEVSDCDMEKGSLRCDANISLRTPSGGLGTKVEIKNLNSFKAVARALGFEVIRQTKVLEEGGRLIQETRLWDDARGVTDGMRSKEHAHDYRYFPEPDLVPFSVSKEQVEGVRKNLPELPAARAKRLMEQYALPQADAVGVTASQATAGYFETCLKTLPTDRQTPESAKAVANWILSDISREMNERNLDDIGGLKFPPQALLELLSLIQSGKISSKMAKEVFVESVASGQSPAGVVEKKGMSQLTDRAALKSAAAAVLQEQTQAVADYRQGKPQALMFLVGQLMRKTRGAASPAISQEILRELLEEKKN